MQIKEKVLLIDKIYFSCDFYDLIIRIRKKKYYTRCGGETSFIFEGE